MYGFGWGSVWYVVYWVVTSAALGDRVACGDFWYVLFLRDPYGVTKDWAGLLLFKGFITSSSRNGVR
jgi:hypothetical protein